MTNELFSGLAGVILGAIIGHFSQRHSTRMQIEASSKDQEKLLKQMLEERNMMNTRLGQISSNTENIWKAIKNE